MGKRRLLKHQRKRLLAEFFFPRKGAVCVRVPFEASKKRERGFGDFFLHGCFAASSAADTLSAKTR